MEHLKSVEREIEDLKRYEEQVLKLEPLPIGEACERPIARSELKLALLYYGDFGVQVLEHLINTYGHCGACGHTCIDYRCKYGKYSFAGNVDFIYEAPRPEDLPAVVDEPLEYLPKELPRVDVVVATGLHSDLYLGLPELLRKSDVKALLVFRDKPGDMPLGVLKQVAEQCRDYGIEFEAPKSSCSLKPRSGVIRRFVEEFRIGRPVLRLSVARRGSSITIRKASLYVSAPCGITWYVVKNLLGYELKCLSVQELRKLYDTISLLHHSYPCTGSMDHDRELGDTVLHYASYIDRESIVVALGLEGELSKIVEERLKPKLS
ncbi:MAG: hypothetical protein DRJ62_05825 [Thermoprotei archaeon]|nr:MAG: hypothetical protein DRJ62_05825 [Thermoprotei archaeon]